MSVATSNDEIFRLLLKQSDQPHEISGELVEDLRVEWAEREAMSRIADLPAVTHEIVMNRWLALAARSPVPIGRGAIRSDHRLATDPFSRTTLEQSFVLPGNEILDFPITGEVAGSFCELLFLATMITTETPAITSWGTSGTFTLYDWASGDVIVRVMGNPDAPEVRHLIANAKTWWTGKQKRVAGRPRKEIEYEIVAQYWREFLAEEGSEPKQGDICDHLAPIYGFSISKRHLRSHITDWKSQGLEWPPKKDI